MHYGNKKIGKNRARDHRIFFLNETVPTKFSGRQYKISSKSTKNCDRRSADRQTDRRKDASDFIQICPTLVIEMAQLKMKDETTAQVCCTWINFQVRSDAVRVHDHLKHVGELVGLVVGRRRLLCFHAVQY